MTNQIENDPDVIEYKELIIHSSMRLRAQLRKAAIAALVFAGCAFTTFLFTDKGPFHDHWSPYGLIADLASMATLLPMVYFCAVAFVAWNMRRETKRDFRELLDDRYGANVRTSGLG